MKKPIATLFLLAETNAWCAEPSPAPLPCTGTVASVIIGATFIVCLGAIVMLCRSLGKSLTWWQDMLSEPISIRVSPTPPAQTNQAAAEPASPPSPVIDLELNASSSRFIALIGMIVTLSAFFEFCAVAIWRYAYYGSIGNVAEIREILIGGMTLFVPYGINQVKNIFNRLQK